jgi:hypothetical protein
MLTSVIPDPTFFHPGSRLRTVSIPDPHQRIEKYFNPKKWFLSSRKYDSGCSSRIRILNFYPSRIPDPGSKRHRIPDTDVIIVFIFILAVPRFQDVLATFQGAKSCLGEILSSCEFIDQVPNH